MKVNMLFRMHPEGIAKPRGGHLSNIELIQRLAERFEIRLLVGSQKVDKEVYDRLSRVPVFTMPTINAKGPSWLWRKRLVKELPNDAVEESEQVFIGSKGTIPHARVLAAATNGGLGIITRDHNEVPLHGHEFRNSGVRDKARGLLYYWEWKAAYEASNVVICNSYHIREAIRRSYVVNCAVVELPEVTEASQPLKLGNVQNISMAGGEPGKGGEVVKNIARLMPELRFHIYNEETDDAAPGNVTFHEYSATRDILKDADCVLVPSLSNEAFGRIAAEALISGVPTFVSDIGGLKEVVDSNSLRAKPDDTYRWVSLIRALEAGDSAVIKEMREAKRKLEVMMGEERRGKSMDDIERALVNI